MRSSGAYPRSMAHVRWRLRDIRDHLFRRVAFASCAAPTSRPRRTARSPGGCRVRLRQLLSDGRRLPDQMLLLAADTAGWLMVIDRVVETVGSRYYDGTMYVVTALASRAF